MSAIHGNIPNDSFPENTGEWQIRTFERSPDEVADHGEGPGLRIVYGCPLRPGRTCGVPLLPDRLPNGAGWNWDGNTTEPTLTPSINCVGGCGWHGFVTKGVIK